ncbi:MAG: hypothetical protein AAFQ37_12005 [Bacteroidota bacterium]
MARKLLPGELPPEDFAIYVRNWQRARAEDMPNLFYGFDTVQDQTERIAAYSLTDDQIASIVELGNKAGEDVGFIVHLGLDENYLGSFAPVSPHFFFILQVIDGKNTEPFEGGFRMQWDPNPTLPTSATDAAQSGIDAIPGAGAYLFVFSWLETPHGSLSNVFELSAAELGRRVKCFKYGVKNKNSNSPSESEVIHQTLVDTVTNGEAKLSVYMGRGIQVSTHPVEFRPILEVGEKASSSPRANNDGGNGGGNFYDYSNPSPPY